MNQNLSRCAAYALAITCWCSTAAMSQHFHDHARSFGGHGGHFAPPICRGAPHFHGGFLREYVVGVPIVQHWFVPTPVFVSPPIPFDRAAALQLNPNHHAGGIAENFARKAVAPRQNAFAVDAVVVGEGGFDDEAEIRRRAQILKASTPAGRMRADRMISSGDQAFADQVFARATARYRDAIAKAPNYAEAHFRLAHAYVATRQYNLALKSALLALELSGTSKRDGFSLEDMYQGDNFARQQHFKRLADAAMREPTDGGLQFLIGFTLQYGAEREKAVGFFRSAEQIAGIQRRYARYFLPAKPVAEAEQGVDQVAQGVKVPAEAEN